MTGSAERGREAFGRRAWPEAYEHFAAATGLGGDDLQCLAVAAHLVGDDDASARAWEAAHARRAADGDAAGAAYCAGWLGMQLMLRGEMAQASGWFARAERLVVEHRVEGPVRGYLMIPTLLQALMQGDVAVAGQFADHAATVARRFDEPDLFGLAVLGQGQVALMRGEVDRAMHLFDEVMVAVTGEELSPVVAGIVYCAVIEACIEAWDLRRAAEWTEALSQWCAAQPGLVPYRGQCLVHRSLVLLARGSWGEAEREAERAREHLSRQEHPALGLALYQRAELHRLRGELDEAEAAYRDAHDHGLDPAPGLALLRLAQGRADAARSTIRRMLDEHRDPLGRTPMLAAAVEIDLATDDVGSAEAAAGELEAIAAQVGAPLLRAMADYADGAVRLARGEAGDALERLRRAHHAWRELEMPYQAARAQLLLGRACALLDDRDTAALELDAARATFEALGARAEAEATFPAATGARGRGPTELTEREYEVLRLVAAGKTNKHIAAELFISEHTVGRHLQNIFRKLDLTSRAAATAYAYEHHLV